MSLIPLYFNQIPTHDEAVKVLGFTTREVTLIGFLLIVVVVLCYTIFRLYKDKNADIKSYQEAVSKERDTLLRVVENNNDAMNKINTTLEIMKEKLS